MNKHTPGRWSAVKRNEFVGEGPEIDVLKTDVNYVQVDDHSIARMTTLGDEADANAALIAAAPDLLAACEWALDLLNQYAPEIGPQSHIPGTQATKDQLRAAIRKAEGGAV